MMQYLPLSPGHVARRGISLTLLCAVLASGCGDASDNLPAGWLESEEPVPTAIVWVADDASFDVLEATSQLEVKVLDQHGDELLDQPLEWESMNPAAVEVDPTGLLTARSNGKALIEVRVAADGQSESGPSASLMASVRQIPTEIQVTPHAIYFPAVGSKSLISVFIWDGEGFPIHYANFLWRSLDESIATVDQGGMVYAKAPGETRIVLEEEGGYIGSSVGVSVIPTPDGLAFRPLDGPFLAGVPFEVEVEVVDRFGKLVDTADDEVTLFLYRNPHSATLTGTTSVRAIDGIATFSDLSIDKAGDDYALAAKSTRGFQYESALFSIVEEPPP